MVTPAAVEACYLEGLRGSARCGTAARRRGGRWKAGWRSGAREGKAGRMTLAQGETGLGRGERDGEVCVDEAERCVVVRVVSQVAITLNDAEGAHPPGEGLLQLRQVRSYFFEVRRDVATPRGARRFPAADRQTGRGVRPARAPPVAVANSNESAAVDEVSRREGSSDGGEVESRLPARRSAKGRQRIRAPLRPRNSRGGRRRPRRGRRKRDKCHCKYPCLDNDGNATTSINETSSGGAHEEGEDDENEEDGGLMGMESGWANFGRGRSFLPCKAPRRMRRNRLPVQGKSPLSAKTKPRRERTRRSGAMHPRP